MKRLAFLLSVIGCVASAQDGAGRDVSVALFSSVEVRSVTVRAAGDGAWFAACATCTRQPFTGEKHLPAQRELYAGGTLRVSDDASGTTRISAGLWHLRRSTQDTIDVVLTLPSERYVAGVVNAEAAADSGPQALRVLAIVARTYALKGTHYKAQPGHLQADLCDNTQCQDLRLGPVREALAQAVRATAGETLWSNGRRAEVYFSQSCGGMTEDVQAAWPASPVKAYLQAHRDPYCVKRNSARWHAEVPLAAVQQIAAREHWPLPVYIDAVRVSRRSVSGRVLEFVVSGDGRTARLSASSFRFGVGRALGWNRVRSDWYDIAVRNGSVVLDGRGFGHGVGLCQLGADEMAVEGRTDRDILSFYFPGTTVGVTSHDGGWKDTAAGPLILRSTQPILAAQRDLLLDAYRDAQRKFPVRSTLHPTVTIAPTTEIFRQVTSLPGWALAATRGAEMTLQPDAVVSRSRMSPIALYRHELLHLFVESEAGANTPLWLREGLVEFLAEGVASRATPRSPADIDVSLQTAASLPESQRAHAQAGALAGSLVKLYGLSTVRGWLSSKVPESAVRAAMTAIR